MVGEHGLTTDVLGIIGEVCPDDFRARSKGRGYKSVSVINQAPKACVSILLR